MTFLNLGLRTSYKYLLHHLQVGEKKWIDSQERPSEALILKAETGSVTVYSFQADISWISAQHVISIRGQLLQHSSTAVIGGSPGGEENIGQWRQSILLGLTGDTEPCL